MQFHIVIRFVSFSVFQQDADSTVERLILLTAEDIVQTVRGLSQEKPTWAWSMSRKVCPPSPRERNLASAVHCWRHELLRPHDTDEPTGVRYSTFHS